MSNSLNRAEEAFVPLKTWKGTVAVIKQVMDHVSPIVVVYLTSFSPTLTSALQLFPPAKSAWMLLSKIPEVGIIVSSEDMEYSLVYSQALLV
jgi:hypothetical protein